MVVKTGSLACMAGGPGWLNANQESIRVTIYKDFNNLLGIAGCLSLVPQLAAASRPEIGLAFFYGKLQGLCTHISHHQDFSCLGVLDNCRDESGGIESDLG
jgi:hypothetical protein